MQRSVFIKTFGCQMNAVDSARMLSLLSSAEYAAAATLEEADLVLLNTCSIRDKADQKIYSDLGTLRRWKQRRPDGSSGSGDVSHSRTGRGSGRAPLTSISSSGPTTSRTFPRWSGGRNEASDAGPRDGRGITHWDVVPHLPAGAVSARVAIMQGCDNYCAYCVVPLVRGQEVSRPAVNILSEVRSLAARGVVEVVLLGQNVNSYGKKEGEIQFPELLRRISRVEGISRVRFITSHPRDLDDRTIRLLPGDRHSLPARSPAASIRLRPCSRVDGTGIYAREYLAKIEALRRVRSGIGVLLRLHRRLPGGNGGRFPFDPLRHG